MYINVHSICIWRKHLVHDKSAPLLYHEQAFQQSLSYWHWVFCSQSQGFADKLLNIWLSGVPNRPWLIVIRVWELWDGFFEFSEQCTSMWRLKNSRVEWALELSLREAGDCWKVWWRWWPLHWSWSGQEEVCQLCVRPVFALAANILPLTFLLLTVPPPPSKITPAHSRHNIMIYADD